MYFCFLNNCFGGVYAQSVFYFSANKIYGKLPGADLLGIEPVSALLNQSPKGNSTEIPGAWSKQDRA